MFFLKVYNEYTFKLSVQGGDSMKANRKALELAMARACLDSRELAEKAQLPRPTLNNAIVGKGIRPSTLGRIARALGVDPMEIMDVEE